MTISDLKKGDKFQFRMKDPLTYLITGFEKDGRIIIYYQIDETVKPLKRKTKDLFMDGNWLVDLVP